MKIFRSRTVSKNRKSFSPQSLEKLSAVPQDYKNQRSPLRLGKLFSSTENKSNTEAKRCFATHDEDIDYFNMRIYIILIACVYIQQFNFVQ